MAHSFYYMRFICLYLYGYHAILGLFWACNSFIDTILGNAWKVVRTGLYHGYLWLVYVLYDGIGAAVARVYAGRFTLLKSDFILEKSLSVPPIRQLYFLPSRTNGGRGMFPSENMNPIYKGMPCIKCAL